MKSTRHDGRRDRHLDGVYQLSLSLHQTVSIVCVVAAVISLIYSMHQTSSHHSDYIQLHSRAVLPFLYLVLRKFRKPKKHWATQNIIKKVHTIMKVELKPRRHLYRRFENHHNRGEHFYLFYIFVSFGI